MLSVLAVLAVLVVLAVLSRLHIGCSYAVLPMQL